MALDLEGMQQLQRTLQAQYAGWWEPICPETGRSKLLWMLAEMGEAIQLIKRNGDAGLMKDENVRREFVEEMCDMLMYFNDICLCYDIRPEELEASYRAKHLRNMTRWHKPGQEAQE